MDLSLGEAARLAVVLSPRNPLPTRRGSRTSPSNCGPSLRPDLTSIHLSTVSALRESSLSKENYRYHHPIVTSLARVFTCGQLPRTW
jgi:hypothetical protein